MITIEQIRATFPTGSMQGRDWVTLCPAHDDHNPSCAIRVDNGKIIVICRAGCNQDEVFSRVMSRLNNRRPPSDGSPVPENKAKGWVYTLERLKKAEANLASAEGFLSSRGISIETARRFRFGFETIAGIGYLVIPTFVDGDLAAVKFRATRPTSRENKWKKWKRDDKTYWLFNRDRICGADPFDDLWITESELDAAMLESMGKQAVSVDSSNHKLTDSDIALLKQFPGSIVFAPDTDVPGVNCALRLAEELGLENPVSVKPTTKDLGDLYAQDPAAFPDKLAALHNEASPLWRSSFRAVSQLEQGDVRLLIKGILPEGNTFNGACSGVGKTWWQLSQAKALATGNNFLGVFGVPARQKVLYLIPEAGDRGFRQRCFKMGIPSDGSVFLCRTMKDGILKLDDPALSQAIKDWKPVIFLDTAIRFAGFKDENSSAENAGGLADSIFAMLRLGAPAVVAAHHSPKSSANVNKQNKYEKESSLENMLRGTGDIGAMCDTVWALRHDDGGKDAATEYLDESKNLTRIYVANVKPRDFQPADPFIIQGKPYIDERGDFFIITNAAAPVEELDKGRRAAALIAADPKIPRGKLAGTLGVDSRSLENVLRNENWKWNATSRTSGFWGPKDVSDDPQERIM